MAPQAFLVDRKLGAVPVSKLLDVRAQVRANGIVGIPVQASVDKPVLQGGQTLEPDVLYPAEQNPMLRYYLPRYRVATGENGGPLVQLAYGSGDGDDEVGRLTVTLAWTPPQAPAAELRPEPRPAGPPGGRLRPRPLPLPQPATPFEVRMMEHVAALTLRFRVGVQSAAGAAQTTMEQSLVLQPLQHEGAGLARSTTIFTDKAQFDSAYQAMANADHGATLDLKTSARVSIRTWRQVMVGRPAMKDQAAVLENRKVLFTQMLHKETLATLRADTAKSAARVQVAAPPADVRERVDVSRRVLVARPEASVQGLQRASAVSRTAVRPTGMATLAAPHMRAADMARTGHVARVQPAAMATVKPAARPAVGPAVKPAVNPALKPAANPAVKPAANPAFKPAVHLAINPAMNAALMASVRPAVQPAAGPAVRPAVGPAARPPVRPAPAPVAAPTVRRVAAKPQVSAATLARVNTPQLKQAVAISDLQVAGRKAVPMNIALDLQSAPAGIDSDVENLQSLPFSFAPATHPDVFSVTGMDSGGIHLLLPLLIVTPDGSQHTVYQDNLMPDVIHVTPSEYRLERDPTAPFLPAISFLASEFSTTDNDTEADVLFRVAAVYRLQPWLDPDVLELASKQVEQKGLVARFTPAVPHEATLTLDLDLLEDGQQRKEAVIDKTAGVTDTLDLDHLSFLKLWRERLAPERGGGISGKVAYRLFDNSPTEVAVRLSLWESSADLFDVSFGGPMAEQPGRYRMIVRNRIESPARISGLPGEVVLGGIAHAVDPQAHVGQLLKPGESCQIEYDVGPEAPPLLSFEPTVIGRAEPDLAALLKLLMVTTGYSALGFSLTVKAAEGTFAEPAAGVEPVVGLLVEFDDGTRVNLSPSAMQADVTLVGRLIDQILGTGDDSQRYFYRVTNLHASGEGARTSWRDGHGTEPLPVGTATVSFDF